MKLDEITINVEKDEESGFLVASWDDPTGKGGISTQGADLKDLQEMVADAVRCHFDEGERPRQVRLHFVTDPNDGVTYPLEKGSTGQTVRR